MFKLVQSNKKYSSEIKDETVDTIQQSIFLLLNEKDEYIGTFCLRHKLTPSLLEQGGHVEYKISSPQREKECIKIGLKFLLDEANKIGLEKILITCNENDISFYNIVHDLMIDMGGNEIPKSFVNNHYNHRVWIVTEKRHNGKIRPLSLAIIRKGNKILANKGYDEKKNEYFYRLPGGGIEFYETAEDALRREIREELGLEVFISKKLRVVENIFTFNNKKGHEIIFLFDAKLSGEEMKKDKHPMIEPDHEGSYSEFIEVTDSLKIYPSETLEILKNYN